MYNYSNNPNQSPGTGNDRNSPSQKARQYGSYTLAYASLICAVLGIITFFFSVPAIFFGALAIIFGLLSRGSAPRAERRARGGIRVGTLALSLGLILTVISFAYIFIQFGSIENFYTEYQQQLEQLMETYANSGA